MLYLPGLALVSLLVVAALPAADLASSENLFFIKRNKNANEVHYDARVESCAWSYPEVECYWRDLEDGPNAYEKIKWFEGPAYGFKVDRSSDSEIKIRLKALPERTITARLSQAAGGGCSVEVNVEISGKIAEFRSVYVYAEENFIGLPKVHYVDILGYSEDGQPVFERLLKTERGLELSTSPPDNSRWRSGAKTWGVR